MGKIIVANWKMNGSLAFMNSFVPTLEKILATSQNQIIVCPPFPFLSTLCTALKGTRAHLGAQNCHTDPQGAFTGEVSASMLADIGCQAVIVGHSERRTMFGETDDLVSAKAAAALATGMTAIICIGETLSVRESGAAIDTVVQQLEASVPPTATPQNTLIAYEPIWAIGTGLTASMAQITEMHQALHTASKVPFPLLYGGSVTDQNAHDILCVPYVDGVLVGGASLKAEAFQKIANVTTDT